MIKTKKLVILGLLISLGLIFSYLETLIPSLLPLPGFKIGLSQIPVFLAFMAFSIKEASVVAIGKTFIGSLISGTFLSYIFIISLSGMCLSLIFLGISKKLRFSVYGSSILSAIGHNLGQGIAIALTLSPMILVTYTPYLILISLGAGFLIGYIAKLLSPILKKFH